MLQNVEKLGTLKTALSLADHVCVQRSLTPGPAFPSFSPNPKPETFVSHDVICNYFICYFSRPYLLSFFLLF